MGQECFTLLTARLTQLHYGWSPHNDGPMQGSWMTNQTISQHTSAIQPLIYWAGWQSQTGVLGTSCPLGIQSKTQWATSAQRWTSIEFPTQHYSAWGKIKMWKMPNSWLTINIFLPPVIVHNRISRAHTFILCHVLYLQKKLLYGRSIVWQKS